MTLTHGSIGSWLTWYSKCKSLKIVLAVSVRMLLCQCSVKRRFYTEGGMCANSRFLFNRSPLLQMYFSLLCFGGMGRRRLLGIAVTMPDDSGHVK